MKLNKFTYHHRNDFKGIYECELCGYTKEGWGYSDANFYDNVIPNAICPNCRKNGKGETEEQLKNRVGRTYHLDLR